MGHQISIYTGRTKNEAYQNMIDDLFENCETIENDIVIPKIKWVDTPPHLSYETVKNLLVNYSRTNEAVGGIYLESIETKKEQQLRNRIKELKTKYAELDGSQYYSPDTIKSQFITCKSCGSKLSVKYLSNLDHTIGYYDSNHCPICHADLRPKTFRERLARLKDNIEKDEQEVRGSFKTSRTIKKYIIYLDQRV